LLLSAVDGKAVQQVPNKKLSAGTYSYEFDVHALSGGSYVIQLIADGNSSKEDTKTFIKL
jgi:hypothetical protein